MADRRRRVSDGTRVTSDGTACALAIGGLDPGGGAGIVADVRAFEAAGAFGCAAVAVITVQSTSGMRAARAVPTRELVAQAREVLRAQRVRAIKVGALGSRANVRGVGDLLASRRDIPAVVDTPLKPTRGRARLFDAKAIEAVRDALIPRATVVTTNVAEAEALLGVRVAGVAEAHDAAIALCRLGATAAIVKGGHLTGAAATDVLAVDGEVIELRARRLDVGDTHGTGCTFAALIAGRLAASAGAKPARASLVEAVRWAKRAHHQALARAVDVGGDQRVLRFL